MKASSAVFERLFGKRTKWSKFLLKIGWLARCCKFSAHAAGKAPYGADNFLCGGEGEKKAALLLKSRP